MKTAEQLTFVFEETNRGTVRTVRTMERTRDSDGRYVSELGDQPAEGYATELEAALAKIGRLQTALNVSVTNYIIIGKLLRTKEELILKLKKI